MKEVKSKYKNPDKFIDKLKNEIKLFRKERSKLRSDRQEIQQSFNRTLNNKEEKIELLSKDAYGEHWISYVPDVTQSARFEGKNTVDKRRLDKSYIGQELWIKAKLIKVEGTRSAVENENKAVVTFELEDVYRKIKE